MAELTDRLADALADRYRIEHHLGEGGMADVYLAEDPKHGRRVAIKVLKPEIAALLGAERFLQEIRTTAALSHPHILPLFDSGETAGFLYYVMPYVPGESLRDRLRRDGQLALEDALRVTEEVAAALDFAHREGVVHRDIKPENILLQDRQALIADFGIALALHESAGERLTQTGFAVGTPAYMSPEQASAERVVDARSDVYSLGSVLYEMLTGEPPFPGGTAQAVLAKLLTDPVPSARRLRSTIPTRVDDALRRALAKVPADRFATAAEFARELRTPAAGDDASRVDLTRAPLSFAKSPHMVGRQPVADTLHAELADLRAQRRGKVVCITGEAGIGKTTVTEHVLADLPAGVMTVARGRCSERLAGAEAYLPLFEALDSLLRGPQGRANGELMVRVAPNWHRFVAPSFGPPEEAGVEGPGAQSQERLKRELAAFFEEMSRDDPLVVFLEDLHWADVSTVDALTYLADRLDAIPALIVVTYRPDDMRLSEHAFLQVRSTLEQRGTLREIQLQFLDLVDVERYLALECSDQPLPGGLAELILQKTEGSPLFMADLVRDLHSRGILAEQDGQWTLTESLEAIGSALPGSIRSMIDRKIERLSERERSIAIAASIQGEEFDAAVIAGALGTDPIEVEAQAEDLVRVHTLCARLREHELPDGTPTLRYRFVHVLYQNTLYESLTPARRAALSLAVAAALERHHGQGTTAVATQLALLYQVGREWSRAADYFLKAAQNAAAVFAQHEVLRLVREGLDVLQRVPQSRERSRTELALRTLFAPAIMTIIGWGAPEAEENSHRLEALCREVGDEREIFAMLCSWLGFHLVRANPEAARPVGEEIIALAKRLGDPAIEVTAHAAFGDVLFLLGDFASARRHQETAMERWRRRQWRELPIFFAQHPVTTGLGSGAWTLMSLGFPDQAITHAQEGVEVVTGLSHPFSSIMAFNYLAYLHEFRGELSEAADALRQQQLADEDNLPYFKVEALALDGRLLTLNGSLQDGVEKMRAALDMSAAAGLLLFRTRVIPWIAEALGRTGSVGEGLALIEDGLAEVEHGGLRTFQAELYRTRAELLRLAERDPAEIEGAFHSALDVSRSQQARGYEIRAAVGLGRFLRDTGRGEEALELVRPIYEWFTEGFETADLRAAHQLLQEIAG